MHNPRRTTRVTALTAAVLLLGAWLSAQDRADRPGVIPRSADEIPADEGVIRGRVVDARSRRPIARATIAIVYDGPAVAATGTNGRYEVGGLEPGDLQVFVRADGYVPSEYGQRRPTDLRATVRVRGGQATTGVNVELQRVGSMSGRIYDALGEGQAGVEVQLLAERYGPGGPMWAPAAFAQTEASGLFQIPDVTPGEYRVQAHLGRAPRSSGTDNRAMYVPTFFPSTTRLEEAHSLQLAPGQEMFGVDFELLVVEPLTISGSVTGPTGEPVEGAQIMMFPNGPIVSSLLRPQAVADDGRFVLTDVAPGAYVLHLPHARHPSVTYPVLVDDHLTNVELVFREATRLSGRIVQDGGGPVPFDPSRLRVALAQPLRAIPSIRPGLSISAGGGARPDGTFSVDVSGPMRLLISNLPDGWALKMVRFNGADITDEVVDFGNGARRDLEVVLTDQIAHVVGRVTDRRGNHVSRYTVVVFPSETDRLEGSPRRVRGIGPDHDGVYHLQGLPAGDYLATAVNALPQNAWFDPRVLEQLWSRATSFRLGDGEYQTLNLQLSTTPINLLNAR